MLTTSTLRAPSATLVDSAFADDTFGSFHDHSPPEGHSGSTGLGHRPVWKPWISDGWIATGAQEVAFANTLRALAADPFSAHTRSDTTACLDALRCGLTVDELLERTPGLKPDRLAAAYAALEHRRAVADHAWSAIVSSGSVSALHAHGEAASRLLPVAVGRLMAAAHRSAETFAAAVLRHAEAVVKSRYDADCIEQALAGCTPGSARGRQLGALLYHPFGDSVASGDSFLANRVGMLTPTRVASLLGELVDPVSP